VTDTAPETRRGVIVAMFSAVFLVGQTAGSFAFGYITHSIGYAFMWTMLASLFLLGTALSMSLTDRRVTDGRAILTPRFETGARMNTNVRLGVVALLMLAMLCVPDRADLAPDRPDVAPPKPTGAQEVDVVAVMIDQNTQQPTVVLQGKRDGARFVLAIGLAEATGIAVPLQGVTPPRPLTHDLFLTLFGRLKVTLTRVVITDLRERHLLRDRLPQHRRADFQLDARPLRRGSRSRIRAKAAGARGGARVRQGGRRHAPAPTVDLTSWPRRSERSRVGARARLEDVFAKLGEKFG